MVSDDDEEDYSITQEYRVFLGKVVLGAVVIAISAAIGAAWLFWRLT